MLDKTIEFHSIIMKNPNDRLRETVAVPEGFSVRLYQKGDEKSWAQIQTDVLEFNSADDALACFNHYLEHEDELKKRQLYVIEEKSGKPVATATAWYSDLNGKPIGVVHALSCLQDYQSLGLGKVAASYMMKCFYQVMPGKEVWLDTQTWSYKALGLYLDLGFIPMKKAVYNDVPNEFDAALSVLKGKMREDKYQLFIERAE